MVVQRGASLVQRAEMKASPDLWIGFWNEIPAYALPKRYIFMNAEPLSVAWWRDNPDWSLAMRKALEVWGYEKSNEAFVSALGVRFFYVPFGYAPYFEATFRAHTEGKGLIEDIDVLFFGTMNPRRQRVIDQLRGQGLNVRTITRANAVYGERLDELLARAKIVILVHQHEEPEARIVDLARLDHLLSNRRFVIHEAPSDSAACAEFERAVTMCRYEDIPRTCAYYLAHPEERTSRAASAYEWFKAERSLDEFLPYDNVIKHFNDLT